MISKIHAGKHWLCCHVSSIGRDLSCTQPTPVIFFSYCCEGTQGLHLLIEKCELQTALAAALPQAINSDPILDASPEDQYRVKSFYAGSGPDHLTPFGESCIFASSLLRQDRL